MSLLGALNVGKSAMAVSQAQIQTTGNNIANVGNADYTRQTTTVDSLPDQQLQPGQFVGTGVSLVGVARQVDDALEARLRSSNSDTAAADTTSQWLSQIESTFGALNDGDLASKMGSFFNSWSDLANKPQDTGLRQTVLQSGSTLAQGFQDLRGSLMSLSGSANDELTGLVKQANDLSNQIATLNQQVVAAEGGTAGTANTLRDARDAALKKLSTLMDVRTVPQTNGGVDVYVGSEPLVLNAQSRGVSLKQTTVNGTTTQGLVVSEPTFKADNGTMTITGGQIGALVGVQRQVNNAVDAVDTQAHALIFELNKLHASGQGIEGITAATSTNAVADPTVPLDDPKSGLKFTPNNGSFVVHVTQKSTGLDTSTLVQVNLNGTAGGTTLNQLAASLGAISGVTASVQGGKLKITSSSPDVQIGFSQDSSGTLAALGVNSFFAGNDARNIAVNATIQGNPNLIAAAKNGAPTDNQTAKAIAALGTTAVASLKGQSLNDSYEGLINGLASAASAAKVNAEATKSVSDTLESQREALSGVSLDEETVNLLKQQRAFQGAAKLISTVDQMMQTLLQMT